MSLLSNILNDAFEVGSTSSALTRSVRTPWLASHRSRAASLRSAEILASIIHFHAQLQAVAVEIENVRPGRMLAPET